MSQPGAERRVKQALTESSALSPEGSAKAQEKQGSHYVAIPARLADHYGIGQGAVLERAYDPETGTLIISLGDADLFGGGL